MLVRWRLLTAAVAALGTGILVRGTVYPLSRETAAREAYSLLGSAAAQTLQSLELTDSALPQRLGNSLAQAGGGLYQDSAVAVYQRDGENIWTLLQSNTGLPEGPTICSTRARGTFCWRWMWPEAASVRPERRTAGGWSKGCPLWRRCSPP